MIWLAVFLYLYFCLQSKNHTNSLHQSRRKLVAMATLDLSILLSVDAVKCERE